MMDFEDQAKEWLDLILIVVNHLVLVQLAEE
jgi:hypothetical protein